MSQEASQSVQAEADAGIRARESYSNSVQGVLAVAFGFGIVLALIFLGFIGAVHESAGGACMLVPLFFGVLAGMIWLLVQYRRLACKMVRLFCPACGKYLPANDPWRCGTCDHEHRDTYSFLDRCEKCGVQPRAYSCYHCGEVIRLIPEIAIEHISTRVANGVAVAPIRSNWVREQDVRQREKSRLSDEIELAKLRKNLAKLTEPPEKADTRDSHIKEILRVPLEGREIRDALREFRKNEREKIKNLGLTQDEEKEEMDALDTDIDAAMGKSYYLK